jgi:voltage-gated potassium channel
LVLLPAKFPHMENQIKIKDWKEKLRIIIFEHHTRAGKLFDEFLLVFILLSVLVVFLDSIKSYHLKYKDLFLVLEWGFTIIFTIEYILRIIISKNKIKYITSFYGIIDFLSIIPTYLSLIYIGSQFLIIIRILRLFRVFRILKLVRFTYASIYLLHAFKHSREKIIIFFGAVLITVTIVGAIMYLIEGPENGFSSIPTSIYWAIVTITTVGFGDITPNTALGQILASFLMITGYAIIAVPTGIVTAEMTRDRHNRQNNDTPVECYKCAQKNEIDARYCKKCGIKL